MNQKVFCTAVLCVLALAAGCTSGPPPRTESEQPMFDLQGHRGSRGLRPENTLAGFSYALSIGVRTLEMDCGVTKDGVVVVSHDSTLNPNITRDAEGKFLEGAGPAIASLTYDELRRYDVGRIRPGSGYEDDFPEQFAVDGERIPRLADVFALVRRHGDRDVRFNIETKIDPTTPDVTLAPEPFVKALIAVIEDARMTARATIQSFDWRTLVLARKFAPDIALVALTDQQPGEDTVEIGKAGASPWLGGLDVDDHGGSVPKTVKALGAKTWSPHARDLTPELVKEAHALNLGVVPWTVNDPRDMEAVLALGVDGLITDRPDLLRSILQAKGLAVPMPAR